MQQRVPFYRSWPLQIWHWLDTRYRLEELWHAMVEVPIPRNAATYFLGGITLFLFGVQAITGILLSLYYQPTPESAYDSILFIMNDVRFGWLIRSIHAWGANLMVIFCVLHLLRVYFQAAYKAPREMTWVAGVFLLIVTLAFGFTGYLLPWDQRAYWATVIGTEIAGAVPSVGGIALVSLRGGTEIGALTLSRFFGIHVLVLPVSLAGLLLLHLVMVHQQGLADPTKPARFDADAEHKRNKAEALDGSEDPEVANGEEGAKKGSRLLPFFPNYVLDEVIAWYSILALIVILATLFPVALEEPADPFVTPAHAKPEWYFLAVYQGLKLVPRTVGILAPMIGILVLMILPFIDRSPWKEWRRRPIANTLAVLIVVVMIVLSVWGWVS